MKNLLMAITMFIIAFGFVAMTMADNTKVKATKLNGEITAVDPAAKTVTVKGKDNKDYTLMVSNRTNMSTGKEKKGMGDLQPGTKISATYVMDGDKMMAKTIHIAKKK